MRVLAKNPQLEINWLEVKSNIEVYKKLSDKDLADFSRQLPLDSLLSFMNSNMRFYEIGFHGNFERFIKAKLADRNTPLNQKVNLIARSVKVKRSTFLNSVLFSGVLIKNIHNLACQIIEKEGRTEITSHLLTTLLQYNAEALFEACLIKNLQELQLLLEKRVELLKKALTPESNQVIKALQDILKNQGLDFTFELEIYDFFASQGLSEIVLEWADEKLRSQPIEFLQNIVYFEDIYRTFVPSRKDEIKKIVKEYENKLSIDNDIIGLLPFFDDNEIIKIIEEIRNQLDYKFSLDPITFLIGKTSWDFCTYGGQIVDSDFAARAVKRNLQLLDIVTMKHKQRPIWAAHSTEMMSIAQKKIFDHMKTQVKPLKNASLPSVLQYQNGSQFIANHKARVAVILNRDGTVVPLKYDLDKFQNYLTSLVNSSIHNENN